MLLDLLINILQEAINLIYIPYTWRNAWKVICQFSIVDDGVVRFVWEMTERRWFYRYNYMRRVLYILDRFSDIECTVLFSLYCCYQSFPHWDVCLGIYIVLRLVSVALYSNTSLCECYAIRTVLATTIFVCL